MPSKIDKVILTNFSALNAKYGSSGAKEIHKAVRSLIAADKARGLITRYFGLDDAATMKRLGADAVRSPLNERQNKTTIDRIFDALAPDYIMLLGSIDIIPHQDMHNPLYSPVPYADPDRFAYGDLPYACEHSYSQRPQVFIGPTRVVGRLPDVTGSNNPEYLLGLLETAASYKATSAEAYFAYFGISTEAWQSSTQQSLLRIFGSANALNTVPPKKDKWSRSLIARKALYVNCHGRSNTPFFSGQAIADPSEYPNALRATFVNGKITEGTLAAVECCYGGQLYEPSLARGQQGICNTYLGNRAYAYFGSTTISYGPGSGNGQADLLCQYFLRSVLAGASIGRAALEARQKFARTTSLGNPVNIKTLAQFNLYGDPSCSPVRMLDFEHDTPPKTPARGISVETVDRIDRASRRRSLFIEGTAILASRSTSRESRRPPSKAITAALRQKARELGVETTTTKSFRVDPPKRIKGMPKIMANRGLTPSAYHVLLGKLKINGKITQSNSKYSSSGPAQIAALVGKEVKGRLISVTSLYSKSAAATAPLTKYTQLSDASSGRHRALSRTK